MTTDFPHGAEPVFTEWPIKEGGIMAAAWTDGNGIPFLALKTLNRIGKTTGLFDWERASNLVSDRVVGFINDRPLVIRAIVNVTGEGLELIVRLPPDIAPDSEFEERFFAAWGSGSPPFSLTLVPTIDHYATNSFPTE